MACRRRRSLLGEYVYRSSTPSPRLTITTSEEECGLDRKKRDAVKKRVALGDGLDVAPAQPVVAVEDAPRRMDRALLLQIGVARARPRRRRRPRSIRFDQVFGRESAVRLVQTAKVVLADQRLPGRVALGGRFYRRGPGPRQVYMSSGGLAARDDRLERIRFDGALRLQLQLGDRLRLLLRRFGPRRVVSGLSSLNLLGLLPGKSLLAHLFLLDLGRPPGNSLLAQLLLLDHGARLSRGPPFPPFHVAVPQRRLHALHRERIHLRGATRRMRERRELLGRQALGRRASSRRRRLRARRLVGTPSLAPRRLHRRRRRQARVGLGRR